MTHTIPFVTSRLGVAPVIHYVLYRHERYPFETAYNIGGS